MSYIEAQDLPEQEKVFLKKDFLGWRVVTPIKIDGKINYPNLLFGGRRGLIIIIITLLMFGIYFMGTKELVSQYKKVVDNPCDFCSDCFSRTNADTIDISAEDFKGLIVDDG